MARKKTTLLPAFLPRITTNPIQPPKPPNTHTNTLHPPVCNAAAGASATAQTDEKFFITSAVSYDVMGVGGRGRVCVGGYHMRAT